MIVLVVTVVAGGLSGWVTGRALPRVEGALHVTALTGTVSHYGDLIDHWLAGGPVRLPFTRVGVSTASISMLTLAP